MTAIETLQGLRSFADRREGLVLEASKKNPRVHRWHRVFDTAKKIGKAAGIIGGGLLAGTAILGAVAGDKIIAAAENKVRRNAAVFPEHWHHQQHDFMDEFVKGHPQEHRNLFANKAAELYNMHLVREGFTPETFAKTPKVWADPERVGRVKDLIRQAHAEWYKQRHPTQPHRMLGP